MSADVSPSQIILKSELNKIGVFKTEIHFHSEVKANISIKIEKNSNKITFPQLVKKVCNFFFKSESLNLKWTCEKINQVQNNQKNIQPSNLEAEQALLGSILVNNDIIDEVSSIVSSSIFYDPTPMSKFMK